MSETSYSAVDKYVAIDAEIKKLEKRRDELKKQVIALGQGDHPGHLGKVTISLQSRKTFDQKAVAALITPEQFESCYKNGESVVVRCTFYDRVGEQE